MEVHRTTNSRVDGHRSRRPTLLELLLPEVELVLRHTEVLHEEPPDPRVSAEAAVDGARDVVDVARFLETADVEGVLGHTVNADRHHLLTTDDVDQTAADLGREMLAGADIASDEMDRRSMGSEEGSRDGARSIDWLH